MCILMNSNQTSISVIMPVYNAETYLRQALDTVLSQSLQDFELLCINDGSTDRSPEILAEYAAKDTRIHVLNQENQGPGPARNTGIAHASGRYMIFLDADDFFEKDLLKTMYARSEETSADITMCRHRFYDTDTNTYGEARGLHLDLLKGHPVLSHTDCHDDLRMINTVALWTNLYRTSFIQDAGLQFPSLANTEDIYFIFMASCLAERIAWTEDVLVNYRRDNRTGLEAHKADHPLCFIQSEKLIHDELQRRNLYSAVERGYVNLSLLHLSYGLSRMENAPQAYAEAAAELVFHFFPDTQMLDHPEDFYINPVYIQQMRRINTALRQAYHSAEWLHSEDLDDRQIFLLNTQKALQQARIEQLTEDMQKLKNSLSFRIGRAVTALPRKLRKLLRKR